LIFCSIAFETHRMKGAPASKLARTVGLSFQAP
jgi:hypothetical protein